MILISSSLSYCSNNQFKVDSSLPAQVERLLDVQSEREDDIERLENLILCHLTNEIVQSHDDLIQNRRVSINNEFYDVVISKSSDGYAYYFEIVKYDAGVKHILHNDEYADLIGLEPDQGAWLRTAIVEKDSCLTVYQLGYSFRRCSDIILRRQYDLFPAKSNRLSPFELKNESYSLKSDPYNNSSLSCFGSPKENYSFMNRVEKKISSESIEIDWEDWDKVQLLSAFISGKNCSIHLQ